VYWFGGSILKLGVAPTQTLLFVWFIFAGSQAIIHLSRARPYWAKLPPARLVNVVGLVNLGLFAVMAIEGWLMALLPWYLIAAMLLLADAFLVGTDLVKAAVVQLSARASGEAIRAQVPAH